MSRPIIAITGPRRGAFGPRFMVSCAVRWYGARPLQVRPGDDIDAMQYDAVVVTGGHDIDPVLYAEEPEVRHELRKKVLRINAGEIENTRRHDFPEQRILCPGHGHHSGRKEVSRAVNLVVPEVPHIRPMVVGAPLPLLPQKIIVATTKV